MNIEESDNEFLNRLHADVLRLEGEIGKSLEASNFTQKSEIAHHMRLIYALMQAHETWVTEFRRRFIDS